MSDKALLEAKRSPLRIPGTFFKKKKKKVAMASCVFLTSIVLPTSVDGSEHWLNRC